MNILDLLQEIGINPKRKASTHGGEYCSACPFCQDGKDRFLIWPTKPNKDGSYQGGRFTCRICGKYGDAITFLRELRGLSYKQACKLLKIEPKRHDSIPVQQSTPKLPLALEPPELWQIKAMAYVNWCHTQLLSDTRALEVVKKRGFTPEAINRFKIGFNPGDEQSRDFYRQRKEWGLEPLARDDGKPKKLWLPVGVVIPTFSSTGRVIKVKTRRSAWKEGDELPKYVLTSGSQGSPSIYGNQQLEAALVLESELDGLLVQQFASDQVFCISLGGASQVPDCYTDQLMRNTPTVLFCPDFDSPGAAAWSRWKKMYPHIERLLTPDGKGPGDAYLAGVDLREWIEAALLKSREKKFS